MKNVNFISAGAGSGKTYSIVKKIVENIQSGVCHADEIILTTFTVAAAEELKEKVRKALYENGLFQEALRLENAAIGTIHSISYQIVARYWYLLNLSAEVRLIADDTIDFYISQSVSRLPEKEDLNLFNSVTHAFSIMQKGAYGKSTTIPDRNFWKNDLRLIIDKIENFGISVDDLSESETMSLDILSGLFSPHPRISESLPSCNRIIADVKSAIRKYEEQQRNGENATSKKVKDALKEFERLVRGDKAPLRAYGKLVKKVLGEFKSARIREACAEEFAFLQTIPDSVLGSVDTIELVEKYVKTIFRLAGKWKEEYEKFKTRRRILDFNDTQRLFDELLDREEVVEELQSRYKLIFVDEFQDSSPQQICFFTKLSHILQSSTWVGDVKQAIYGFRGTDTSVVREVIESIQEGREGNTLSTLDYSWRSNSAIVNLVNDVFVKVFSDIPKDLVTLKMPDPTASYDRPAEHGLLHLHVKGRNKGERYQTLAREIKELHAREGLKYREIAVLCRDRYEMSDFTEAFKEAGIPYKKATDHKASEGGNDALNLLNAIVAVAASDYNNFSKSLLLYYSEPGQTASQIVSERLKFLGGEDEATDPLNGSEIVGRIKDLRLTVGNNSIPGAVETLLIELDAMDLLRRIDPTLPAYRMVTKYVECARSYEEICRELSMGCSLAGFVEWIRQTGMEEAGDEDGITVSTYHKAKGLEWKCVILGSLHRHPIDRDKVFFGVNVIKSENNKPLIFFAPGFLGSVATQAFNDAIERSTAYVTLRDDVFEESKRLLYVGMTRPREILVTLTSTSNGTVWPDVVSREQMNATDRDETEFEWLGHKFENRVVEYTPLETEDASGSASSKVSVLKGAGSKCEYELRDIAPSHASPLETLKEVELAGEFGARLKATGAADDAILGNCIHRLLCAYRNEPDFATVVRDTTREYGVTLNPEEFVVQAQNMYHWLRTNYGDPVSVEREVPFSYRLPNGQIVNGEIDMIYRTQEGEVLVDYKTCMRPATEVEDSTSKFYAGKYSGQLALYEEALRRAGRSLRDSIIIYFNLGIAVRIKF